MGFGELTVYRVANKTMRNFGTSGTIASMEYKYFAASNDDRVDYLDFNSGSSDVLIYHHGTPCAGPISQEVADAALKHNFRVVELIRPGYGQTTRKPGRTVAEVATLTAQLADHLGVDRFVSMGWSGGGPHVLATVALLPERCVAGMCIAGVGMFGQSDLDFLAGMGQDNIEEFSAAIGGEDVLRAYLEPMGEVFKNITGETIIDSLRSLLPPVDQAALTGKHGEELAEVWRWAVATGIDGWLDDDIAFVKPWGFELAEISRPVTIWQGSEDLMVPFAHGQWLAKLIPNADVQLIQGEGHLSIGARALDEGFAFLRKHL
jgi:pimeloyl-ACP methyl ester carboxylesterase